MERSNTEDIPEVRTLRADLASYAVNVIEAKDLQITLSQRLSVSPYGFVCKGKWKSEAVAVKELQLNYFSAEERRQFESDVEKFQKVKHSNMMPIYCYQFYTDKLTVVQPRMKNLSLKELIRREDRPRFEKRMRIVKEVVQCISWTHSASPPLYNLDLRSNNILIGQEMQVLVDGFVGLSRIKNVNPKDKKLFMKSFKHCAPELLLGQSYNEKADIWSIGLCKKKFTLHSNFRLSNLDLQSTFSNSNTNLI